MSLNPRWNSFQVIKLTSPILLHRGSTNLQHCLTTRMLLISPLFPQGNPSPQKDFSNRLDHFSISARLMVTMKVVAPNDAFNLLILNLLSNFKGKQSFPPRPIVSCGLLDISLDTYTLLVVPVAGTSVTTCLTCLNLPQGAIVPIMHPIH